LKEYRKANLRKAQCPSVSELPLVLTKGVFQDFDKVRTDLCFVSAWWLFPRGRIGWLEASGKELCLCNALFHLLTHWQQLGCRH